MDSIINLLSWYYFTDVILIGTKHTPAQFLFFFLTLIIVLMVIISMAHSFHCWADDKDKINEFWTGLFFKNKFKEEEPLSTLFNMLFSGTTFGIFIVFLFTYTLPFSLPVLTLIVFGLFYRSTLRAKKTFNAVKDQFNHHKH